ncbi:MAG: transposon-transfer assisting family protein [Christensenellales bacterium]
MNRFTVEETNLMSIYIYDTRGELIEEMTGALPYMDDEMRDMALRTLTKLRAMSDAEFATLEVSAADEV